MISQFDVESGLGFPVKIRADARLPWKMKILGGCVLLTIGVYVYGSWNAGHEAPEKSFLEESVLENYLGDGALYFTTLKADKEDEIPRKCGSEISTVWQEVTIGPFLEKGMKQVQYFAKPGSLGCFVYKNSKEHLGYIKLCGPTPDSCGADELGYKFRLGFFRIPTKVTSRVEEVTENFPPELEVNVGWEYAYDGADSFVYRASDRPTDRADLDPPTEREFTIRAKITGLDVLEGMLGTAELYFTTLQDGPGERCGSDISMKEQDVEFPLFTKENLKTVHYSAPLPAHPAGDGCFVYKDSKGESRYIALCGPEPRHCGNLGTPPGYKFTFQYFKIAPVEVQYFKIQQDFGTVTVNLPPNLQVQKGWQYAYTGHNSFVYAKSDPSHDPIQFTIRADIIGAEEL